MISVLQKAGGGFAATLCLLVVTAAVLGISPAACFGAEGHTVWIEGENAASNSFGPGRSIQALEDGSGASGGEFLWLRKDEDPGILRILPFYADYVFTVKAEGDYRFWLAGTPQNVNWASPMFCRFDAGGWMDLKDKARQSGQYGGPWPDNLMCWTMIDTVHLKPGEHRLRFEVRSLSLSKMYSAAIDAIVLTTDASFAPEGNHPSLSPWPAWEETLKGISFEDYKKKLEERRYQGILATTEEDVNAETAGEVMRKLMARPLPKLDPSDKSIHRFGLNSMTAPDVVPGKDEEQVKKAFELLARVGVDTLRTNASCWHKSGLNHEDFKELEYQIQRASEHGMNFMFMVGYPTGKYSVNPSHLSTWKPEYEPLYRQYLHTLFTFYGHACQYVELGNEVDVPAVWYLGGTPEMYVRDTRILREELAKTNVKTRVVAFGATGSRDTIHDGPNTGRTFVRKCFQEGIHKYVDGYSVHYTWEMNDRDLPAFFRREMTKYGKTKPLVNSEESSSKPYDIAKLFARNLFLNDMEAVYDFLAKDFYEAGNLLYCGLFDRHWTPKLRLLAYASAVDAMKHRRLVGMAAPAKDVEAYVLEYEKGYKGAGPAYSVVMWRNGELISAKPNIESNYATKQAPVQVSGLAGAVSAQNWKLDPIKMGKKGSVSVGTQPVIVYANRLPKWKLISAKKWLESFERYALSRQATAHKADQ